MVKKYLVGHKTFRNRNITLINFAPKYYLGEKMKKLKIKNVGKVEKICGP